MLIDKLKKNFIKSKTNAESKINIRIESHKEKITEKMLEASSNSESYIDHWFSPGEDEYVVTMVRRWLVKENMRVNITESLFGNTVFDISGWS
jgi:hypothetical protein